MHHKDEMISVVIPVYNVEKYLKRCIDSVISQTYRNIEIILVDDGSPDKCGEICDQYAFNDYRIKVIHKENGGLSDARNIGTEVANGKYITFIDSDDYISEDYVGYLHDLLIKTGADISVCCMIETDKDIIEYDTDNTLPTEQELTGFDANMACMGRLCGVLVTACGKLYRAEIVKKYPFPIGKKHEDEANVFKYYYESHKVVVGNRRLYAYYQNQNSITHTINNAGPNEDYIWALQHRARFFEEEGQSKLARRVLRIYTNYCIFNSLKYDGKCDKYLEEVSKSAYLSKCDHIKLHFYFCPITRWLFKVYLRMKSYYAIK